VTSYAEHVRWCKQRAREYLDMGRPQDALSSMISDMNKHPGTAETMAKLAVVGMMELQQRGADGVRHWIDGFGE
jgi:hypothetical protein